MDRVQLKSEGRRHFKKNYGRSVGAYLLPAIPAVIVSTIITIFAAVGGLMNYLSSYTSYYSSYKNFYSYQYSSLPNLQLDSRAESALMGFLSSSSILIIVLVLILLMLEVMICRFFIMNRKQESCKVFSTVFSFKGAEYFKIFGGMFLKNLYEFLWSLLFIIPGIIKSFSYFMVPYILAENPNIGANRAITISKQTMNGSKWDLFVFELSFIGWWLLCYLPVCFGLNQLLIIFYVGPYYEAAKAEYYCGMKEKAKKMNICDADELA